MAHAQNADPQMLQEIIQLHAIDNHAHPQAMPGPDGAPDTAFNALSCDNMDFPFPAQVTLSNSLFADAWRTLYGVTPAGPPGPDMFAQVAAARERVRAERGANYPDWVLGQLNIDVMFANRIAPGPGLNPPHFRWVSYGDPMLNPFDTTSLQNTPDRVAFYAQQQGYFGDVLAASARQLPASFDAYLSDVVTPTLERQHRDGAIAIKFVSAYLRSLNFADATQADAARIYRRYRGGGVPSAADYKTFQDYMFRYIAREAGRLNMAVHIHTGGGCGGFFYINSSNPMLLESAINDPSLRGTNFVLVHGGYPWPREVEALLLRANVYADFSAEAFLLTPEMQANNIRGWLEFAPEKVMFGTDAVPVFAAIGWEDVAYMANSSSREALAIALTGMVRDGVITRARASEIAALVMRGNAARLYGFNPE